jgi:hypothetical protein
VILKFPENREINREFLRIRGKNGVFGRFRVNSRSNFSALQANSLSQKEQGIFLQEQGIFPMEQGIFGRSRESCRVVKIASRCDRACDARAGDFAHAVKDRTTWARREERLCPTLRRFHVIGTRSNPKV